jgi:Fe2+ or Zn2+ uptake regulation protein
METSSITDQVTRRLRAEGGRMTSQRKSVLSALQELCDHPTAEEIYAYARQQDASLNLSTVYRTLRWLETIGLVNPCWFGEESRAERFDTQTANTSANGHHHFVCRGCGSVNEFSSPQTSQVIQAYQTQFGGRVDEADLTLYGLCPNCLPAAQPFPNGSPSIFELDGPANL